MGNGWNFSVVSVFLLAGCVASPPLKYSSSTEEGSKIREMEVLIKQIVCQTKRAFAVQYPMLPKGTIYWRAKVTVTNSAKDEAGVDLNPLSWLVPSGVDKLTLKPGLDFSRSGDSSGGFVIDFNVRKDERVTHCDGIGTGSGPKFRPADFSLANWLAEYTPEGAGLTLIDQDIFVPPATINFTTKVETVSLVKLGADIQDAAVTLPLGADYKRTKSQNLIFSFSAVEETTPKKEQKPARSGGKKATGSRSSGNQSAADQQNNQATDRIILQQLQLQ